MHLTVVCVVLQHPTTRHDAGESPKYVLEGHTEAYPIKVECRATEIIHIRHCHGTDCVIPITVTGFARSIYVGEEPLPGCFTAL